MPRSGLYLPEGVDLTIERDADGRTMTIDNDSGQLLAF